jgi:hypothetical protein
MRYDHLTMLPEMAFKPVGKRMTLEGGGKGGSSKPATSTSTGTTYTSNVPEWMKPYQIEGVKQAGREIFQTDASGKVTGVQGYDPYTGERIAGFSPDELAAQQESRNMMTPEGFAQGTAGLTAGQQASMYGATGGLQQAMGYQAGPMEQMGMSQTPVFGQNIAEYYMSPYQQAVTDSAIRKAQDEAERQRANFALGSIGRGTFGGAREGLMQAAYAGQVGANIGDIQSKGAQEAYLNAQQQFERDRTAGMSAEERTLAAETQRRQLEEQARQFEAGLGKDIFSTGLSGLIDSSKGLGAMAATQQEADLARLSAQALSGSQQREQEQRALDLQYQQAMEARDWNKSQLEWYNNLIQGNVGPASGTTTSTSTQPAPSTSSQIAGLGLGALGLYKALS